MIERAKELVQAAAQPGVDGDVVLEALDLCEELVRRARELKAEAEQAAIGWIQRSGEDLVCGDVRYYVGTEKKVKPKDKAEVLDALLNAKDGDVAGIGEYLSSDPFKHGAVRELVGEEKFTLLFEVRFDADLKTGKPVKGLHKTNAAFVRPKKGA